MKLLIKKKKLDDYLNILWHWHQHIFFYASLANWQSAYQRIQQHSHTNNKSRIMTWFDDNEEMNKLLKDDLCRFTQNIPLPLQVWSLLSQLKSSCHAVSSKQLGSLVFPAVSLHISDTVKSYKCLGQSHPLKSFY